MKKRVISAILVLLISYFALCGRIFGIINTPELASAQTDIRVRELAEKRGTIYDKNGYPLVNRETNTIVCAIPNTQTSVAIAKLKGKAFTEDTLLKGYFTTFSLNEGETIEPTDNIKLFETKKRYSDNVALHILGYLDGDGNGVCGVEKYFENEIKNADGKLSVAYSADAFGRMLTGEAVEIRNENYYSLGGIALTIDREIQVITENALKNGNIDKGAAVVIDVDSGAVLACASTPTYDRENIEKYLDDENSPFLNRALSAFPVGSVFKPVTVAAAIENGISEDNFVCTGSIEKSENIFNCNKTDGHGKVNLNTALAFSCNPYFIDLSTKVGAKKLLETAKKLGFQKSTNLGNGFMTDSGALPDINDLNSDAAVGNFGFGQGKLTATPLQIAACFAVFANGGTYHEPYIYKGAVDEYGALTPSVKPQGEKALKAETCKRISEALFQTTTIGTGKGAYSSLFKECAKTATAQSGQYDENGVEIKYCWFAGYFPYENPKYAVCILKENGSSGGSDGAPVFKEISEKIFGLK